MQTLFPFTIPRRRFVKAILLATGYSVVGDSQLFQQCARVQAADLPYPDGTFALSLEDFPELKTDYGSVLVAVPDIPDIIITRWPGDRFYAVTSVCTHLGCSVGVYDQQEGALVCPCHGSRYSAGGDVLDGPAPRPLYSYTTHYNGSDGVTIDLVKFSFPISAVIVPIGRRLRIRFSSETGYNYEVRYKSSMTDPEWAPIGFSETPDGAADQTLIFGTGDPMSLYVEAARRSGFYMVARWKLLGA